MRISGRVNYSRNTTTQDDCLGALATHRERQGVHALVASGLAEL